MHIQACMQHFTVHKEGTQAVVSSSKDISTSDRRSTPYRPSKPRRFSVPLSRRQRQNSRFKIMPTLSAAQIVEHPEFDSVFWDIKPAKKGEITVANGRRGGPLQLAYEIHGEGAIKLLWIIGLGGWISTWQRQIKDFGHSQNTNRSQSQKYTLLVFDNRGMGDTDKPWSRYSTSEMAKDAIELCDHVGWTSKRQLHVIGSSMGGMIAQEMAYMAPERIASLSLIATGPYLFNTVGYIQNLRDRINLFLPKDIDKQLEESGQRLFSPAWLSEPDAEGHFPTNGDRFAAQELSKRRDTQRFSKAGFILQAIAANWHYKSSKQLAEIGDKVGRQRIQVLHGKLDKMITYPHGELLAKELGGTEKGLTVIAVEDKAHALHIEWRKELTRAVAALVDKTETLPKDPKS